MLCANGKSVFVSREGMTELRTNSYVTQWADSVVVWTIKCVTFVIPVLLIDLIKQRNHIKHKNMYEAYGDHKNTTFWFMFDDFNRILIYF